MRSSLFVAALAPFLCLLADAPYGASRTWSADVANVDADEPTTDSNRATARAKMIEGLIAQLGGDDFFARERAQQELAAIGIESFDALSEAAENNDDVEVQLRARYLVRMMRLASVLESDPPEIKNLLGDYESRGEADRIERIKQVATLSDDKGLSVLCRLVRFERSPILSKEAAAAILVQKWPADKVAAERRAEMIRRGIGQSARPAAAWLVCYLDGWRDPAAAVGQWQRLVAAEERRAIEAPHQTRPDILSAMWRVHAVLLRRAGRELEAERVLSRLIDREEMSIAADTLEELLRWLVSERAFGAVDRLIERFSQRFADDPILLYSLADARKAQDRDDLARQAVAEALAIDVEGDAEKASQQHWRVASELMRRHHWRWAEGEFRRVAELAPRNNRFSIDARVRLGEALHDRGADGEAATVLEEVVVDMDKNHQDNNEEENTGRTIAGTRARMHFFFACSLTKPDQQNERIQRLLDAVQEDRTDADALIALYRIEGLDPPLVEQNRKRIGEAAEIFRQQIQQQPDDPTPYNQFAWLVANTEGDYKEALQYSEKSLELVRTNPRFAGSEASFLDTLGRCYYAVGDLENAVKTQAKAVEIDPESGLMSSQLEIFRQALEKSKKP
ncbi:MAG TPA: hypothetical protein VHC22_04925 [Pirellulales bacterium]|nr:hypothetical protein [Pirellulales bacterium]